MRDTLRQMIFLPVPRWPLTQAGLFGGFMSFCDKEGSSHSDDGNIA